MLIYVCLCKQGYGVVDTLNHHLFQQHDHLYPHFNFICSQVARFFLLDVVNVKFFYLLLIESTQRYSELVHNQLTMLIISLITWLLALPTWISVIAKISLMTLLFDYWDTSKMFWAHQYPIYYVYMVSPCQSQKEDFDMLVPKFPDCDNKINIVHPFLISVHSSKIAH